MCNKLILMDHTIAHPLYYNKKIVVEYQQQSYKRIFMA